MKAKRIFEDYHRENGGGYGPVVKQLMLEFIHQRECLEREREDRHKADLANIEIDTTFKEQIKLSKEQIKVLKGQVEALAESSRTSSRDARTANIISFASMAIALLAIILRVC